jgi:hypothetical protein
LHYYLAYIGTDPASQGKGHGTAWPADTFREPIRIQVMWGVSQQVAAGIRRVV